MFTSNTLSAATSSQQLLANSQQLRAEFTFLLRALDSCASSHINTNNNATANATGSSGQRLSSRSLGTAVFTYSLEVALTLARFDVVLSGEERRLLVHAFDSLLDGTLASLHRVTEEITQLDELAQFLKDTQLRLPALDLVDWHHLAAKYLTERDPAVIAAVNSINSTQGAMTTVDSSEAAVALSRAASINDSFSGSIGGQSVVLPSATSVDAVRLYTNVLLRGTFLTIGNGPTSLFSEGPDSQGLLDSTNANTNTCATPSASPTSLLHDDNNESGNGDHVVATPGGRVLVIPHEHFSVYHTTKESHSVSFAPVASRTFDGLTSDTNCSPTLNTDGTVGSSVSVKFKKCLALSAGTSEFGQGCLSIPETKELALRIIGVRRSDSDNNNTASDSNAILSSLLRFSLAPASACAAVDIGSTPKSKNGESPAGGYFSDFITLSETPSLAATLNDGASEGITPCARGGVAPGTDAMNRLGTPTPVEDVRRKNPDSSHSVENRNVAFPKINPPSSVAGGRLSGSGPFADNKRTTVNDTTGALKKKESSSTVSFPPLPTGPIDPTYSLMSKIVHASLSRFDRRFCSEQKGSLWSIGSVEPQPQLPLMPLESGNSLTGADVSVASFAMPMELAERRCVSAPMARYINELLDSIEAARASLLAIRRQIRSEVTLLCFRLVSTVIDLLLPAAERRGKNATLFYRKWLCDVYRVLHEEGLLRLFSSLVNRARQTGVAEGTNTNINAQAVTSSVPPSSPSTRPPMTPKNSSVHRRYESVDMNIGTQRGSGSGDLGDELFIDNSSLDLMSLPPSVRKSMNDVVGAAAGGLTNEALQTLDSTRGFASDSDAEREEEEYEHAAVGALFRTFRREVSANAGRVGGGGSRNDSRRGGDENGKIGAAGGAGASSHDSPNSVHGATSSSNVAVTLFRSLHGTAAIPPAGHLGTRLMFTLLNGTDVNSTDLREDHTPDSGMSPHMRNVAARTRTTSMDDMNPLIQRGRQRSESMPPISPPLRLSTAASATSLLKTPPNKLPMSASSCDIPSTAGSGFNPQQTPSAAPSTTTTAITTLIAMPHHHRFRYPVVRHTADVKNLYMLLVGDAEVSLSPHDPLRAAIVLNCAEFLATVCNEKSAAYDVIEGYLTEVALEPVTQPVIKQADVNTSATTAALGGAPVGGTTPAPAPSGFSVTSVRRGQAPTVATAPPPTPATPGLGGGPVAQPSTVSIPEIIASWQTKEESHQFMELLGLLKTASRSLAPN